jgi:hypothetical protein
MSNFRLYPVPESKLSVVEALIEQAFSETPQQPRATLRRAKEQLRNGYGSHTMAAYVDNLSSAKHCLILMHVPGFLTEGTTVVTLLVYSVPEERGPLEYVNTFHRTIDNFVFAKGANTSLGSSRLLDKSRGIESFWKAGGYKEQETTFVKYYE